MVTYDIPSLDDGKKWSPELVHSMHAACCHHLHRLLNAVERVTFMHQNTNTRRENKCQISMRFIKLSVLPNDINYTFTSTLNLIHSRLLIKPPKRVVGKLAFLHLQSLQLQLNPSSWTTAQGHKLSKQQSRRN